MTTPDEATPPDDPRKVLDEAPISRAQIAAIIVATLLCALDGYDVLAVSFAAPGISQAWGIDKAALGLVLSSGLVGAAIGSLLIAPFGDVIGRRKMVIVTLLLMAAGMLMCAFSRTVLELAAWRVLTGIGIGAMVPIILPLAAEFSNMRYRALAIGLVSIGYPVGGALGGFMAAMLLRWFGWEAVFLAGALLSFAMWPVVLRWLPEPLAFLLERRDDRTLDRVNAFLRRCGQAAVASLPPLPTRAHSPYREIFLPPQRLRTAHAAAINLLFILTAYYMLGWMPQLVADMGFTPSTATLISSLASLAGGVSCILVGVLAARVGIIALVSALAIGLGATVALFGYLPGVLPVLAGAAVLVGLCLYGGTVAVYTLVSDSFDARMRATGVGFVMGLGRISGACAPAIAGGLFSIGIGRGEVGVLMGATAVMAGLLALLTRRGRSAKI